MDRRALLGTAAGSLAAVAGCSGRATEPRDVVNPTGRLKIRPLNEPFLQNGLTAQAGQYVWAKWYEPGDTVAVRENADGEWITEEVDDLAADQFAVLIALRTAGTAPAGFWPTPTGTSYERDRLRIELTRDALGSDGEPVAAEVVGVSLVTFESKGEAPAGADLVFPSGATLSVGRNA